MSLKIHGAQFSYHSIINFKKTLKFNWLCSKMSKCNVKWAASRYIVLP